MAVALVSFFCVYYVIVISLIVGWECSVRKESVITSVVQKNKITVIIPCRNEEASIGILLEDLRSQSYQNFEIIIVDDHSTDSTKPTVLNLAQLDSRIRIFSNIGAGKKSALTTAIEHAAADVIVTMDADCRVQPGWLTIINEHFHDNRIKMLVGGVAITNNKTLFYDAQSIEFASLIGSGVATLFFGIPTMCNGANLAFRRQIFHEVGGYSDTLHIPSGDDEFLLKKIHHKYPSGVRFMGTGDAIVLTAPQKTLRGFLHQRIRWAGKWRYNLTFSKSVLAVYIFLFQLVTILLPGFVIKGTLTVACGLMLWCMKVFLEFLFLKRTSFILTRRWNGIAFIVLELIYPVYVVCIALVCNFLPFTWKERRLRSGEEKTG